jgi:hypothetical protein
MPDDDYKTVIKIYKNNSQLSIFLINEGVPFTYKLTSYLNGNDTSLELVDPPSSKEGLVFSATYDINILDPFTIDKKAKDIITQHQLFLAQSTPGTVVYELLYYAKSNELKKNFPNTRFSKQIRMTR